MLDYKLSILIFIVLFGVQFTIGQNTNYFFSLDNHRHVLCLNKLIGIEQLDYEYFENALAELLTQSESWESLLSAHVVAEETPAMPQSLDLRV